VDRLLPGLCGHPLSALYHTQCNHYELWKVALSCDLRSALAEQRTVDL
jgi:hypothetical protein